MFLVYTVIVWVSVLLSAFIDNKNIEVLEEDADNEEYEVELKLDREDIRSRFKKKIRFL